MSNCKYKYIINKKYENLTEFIHELPEKFDYEGKLIYDSRNKVKVFTVNDNKIVVKKYKIPLFHQRIDYTLIRPSKAKRAYLYGMKLINLNINTPEPIACIEEYKGGLFYKGYFFSTYCGDPDARCLREEGSKDYNLIDALIEYIIDCHEKEFLHGDCNLSNYLYHKDETKQFNYEITTIDINRSHFIKNPSKNQCLKSMMRLTHVRSLLKIFIERYAEKRKWNKEECWKYVEEQLSKFERRKKFWNTLKDKK